MLIQYNNGSFHLIDSYSKLIKKIDAGKVQRAYVNLPSEYSDDVFYRIRFKRSFEKSFLKLVDGNAKLSLGFSVNDEMEADAPPSEFNSFYCQKELESLSLNSLADMFYLQDYKNRMIAVFNFIQFDLCYPLKLNMIEDIPEFTGAVPDHQQDVEMIQDDIYYYPIHGMEGIGYLITGKVLKAIQRIGQNWELCLSTHDEEELDIKLAGWNCDKNILDILYYMPQVMDIFSQKNGKTCCVSLKFTSENLGLERNFVSISSEIKDGSYQCRDLNLFGHFCDVLH